MSSINNERLMIDSGNLLLGFTVGDKFQWDLVSGGNRKSPLLGKPGKNDSFWEIEFRNVSKERKLIKESEAEWTGHQFKEDAKKHLIVQFNWAINLDGKKPVQVKVTGTLTQESNLSTWDIECNQIPKGWAVTQIDFPVITYIPSGKGLKLATPLGWGIESDVKEGINYDGLYPSCLACMQFVALYKNGEGAYIATHDKNAHHKAFRMKADKKNADFRIVNWTAIPDKPSTSFKLPYSIVIGAFTGDYNQAAEIYRKFSYQTQWGKIKTISKRNLPEWLKKTDLWLRPDGNDPESYPALQEAVKFFDVPTSLHWYRWHQIPYDTFYPEYFPARPEFKGQVAEMQKLGKPVMPYINGRLWDPAAKTWKSKKAFNYAAKQDDGSFVTEIYGSKVPLHPMCPHTKFWQDTVKGLVQRIFKELKTTGVYIDQIGASWPHPCFNPNHKHPLGCGNYWYLGYRKLLSEIRKIMPKDKIITTEENAECWIDQFDAQLVLNMHAAEGKWIPLYPLVYADRAINFGFLYLKDEDIEKSLPFRVKMEKCLLYGSQLGWVFPRSLMKPPHRKEAEFLRQLAKVRAYCHDFIAGGRLLTLLDVNGKNPKVKGEGQCIFGPMYKIDQKAVEASLWISEKGKYGIILANITDKALKIELTIPESVAPFKTIKGKTLSIYGSEGLIKQGKLSKTTISAEISGATGLLITIS